MCKNRRRWWCTVICRGMCKQRKCTGGKITNRYETQIKLCHRLGSSSSRRWKKKIKGKKSNENELKSHFFDCFLQRKKKTNFIFIQISNVQSIQNKRHETHPLVFLTRSIPVRRQFWYTQLHHLIALSRSANHICHFNFGAVWTK